ncbi:hypothetical protein S7711_03322 [Stachybotrys chartarum IBT 7711]|uniref:Uncharacterized protein n=1 Tax=Stachybotrys chartarum (strain CBS 109288 / IBT 7711) TaxID=1280523 RepID=A0A084AUP2_STACB|nr:hypothetical protein S7711_03322 [Stachybotrys chartarum IBT 7711]KFA52743.1 hypothetical protein S40293_00865 [Stachybotrys chartarum IBT 40293]
MSVNVNKPMNKEKKEADVNRKLQLYGILTAFQNGKVPSNDQIDVALNSFLNSAALSRPSNDLSSEGKVLVEDLREVVKQSKNLLLSKNEGNLIQDFIWQTTHFDPKAVNAPNAPVNKDTAKRDGDEALEGLRTLGTLLITNGQFRKLLQDATTLLRDIAGDAAVNTATKVRPSDESLSQIDRPAEDNTWHDKPDFSKEKLRKQAKNIYGGDPRQDAHDVAQAGKNAGNVNTSDPRSNDPNAVDQNAAQGAVRDTLNQKVQDKMDPEVKQSVKQRNEEYRRRTREYFNKKVPHERKENVIFRLKKMILECQQHPDYTQAIETLLKLAETYGRHGRQIGEGSAGTAKEARTGLRAAEHDLRTLVERFANGTSTADLWESIEQIYKDADRDQELKDWFKQTDSYIRRCLLEQGYILEDQSSQEWDRLYENGRFLLREKYRAHTDRVVDEIKFLADQFDKDPHNQAFGHACQKLFHDLGHDENGKPVFKPHLIKDLTDVILPAIMENVAYIPIPRIEYSDPQFDAIIENLVLESDNFMPNVAEIASENYFRWGRKKIANKNKNTVEVKVSGIQMDLRDVSFHVKRKQGFPSLTDTGVADIALPGDGFSFKIKLSTADSKDRQNFFKVEKVDVDFKQLKIKLVKSNHKLLFGLFKPIMLKVLRPPLQKAVEKAIKDQCNKFDTMLYQIKQEVDRVNDQAKANPEHAPSIYQRYYQAWQKRMLQGKEKAQAATQDKKVNVAMDKEHSIFPNIHLPGGISSKATEYRELARKGDKWESPVFSIGSSKKSTDIPSAPKIEKKPHAAANPHAAGTNGFTNGHTNGHANGHSNGFTNGPTAGPGNGYTSGQQQPILGQTGTSVLPSLDVNQGMSSNQPLSGKTEEFGGRGGTMNAY